jgi:hypothetical protein
VPVPEGFGVTIQTETVSGGSSAAFGEATVSFQNETFQYELEWQKTSGGEIQQTLGVVEELTVRTLYLADGVEYRFRARTWSAGTSSDWTDYVTRTATADPDAPGAPGTVSATGGVGDIAFEWTAPNSANYFGARLYINTIDSFGSATLIGTEYGAPSAEDGATVAGIAPDSYYGWVVSINGSGVESSPTPTGLVTVT